MATPRSTFAARGALLAAVAALLGAVTIPGAVAAATTARQRIAAAQRQYLAQEYEKVLRLLGPVVQSEGSTNEEQIDAYELIGLSRLILGDRLRAREAFENLLRLDPAHELNDPSGSPKLRSFFEAVKTAFGREASPSARVVFIEPSNPRSAVAGRKIELAARASSDLPEGAQLLLRHRIAGELSFEALAMVRSGGDRCSAVLLVPERDAPFKIEYYVEARSAAGQRLGRAGSPIHPLAIEVTVPRRDGGSILRKWWFWTAIGAAVVAGITVSVVVSRRETAPRGNLDPGIVELR